MEKREIVNHKMMDDEQLILELRGSNWDKYGADVVKEYPQMLERLAPRYFKIKKSLEAEEEEEEEEAEEEK